MSKKLLQLIKDNVNRTDPAVIVGADDGSGKVTMYLYDMIDEYYGVSALELNQALVAHADKEVHLRIKTPGGDVFESEAMATFIKQHGNVIGHIDGYAASAGTRVASACKSVEISEQGFFMIHESMTLAYGNKGEIRKTANLLEKVDTTIVADYVKKTGRTVEEVTNWIDEETWFTAAEALEYGFVDSVYTGDDATEGNAAAQAKAKNWNLSAFANAPAALTAAPSEPAPEEPNIAALAAQQAVANKNRLRLLEFS